jgi:hypothetical protein
VTRGPWPGDASAASHLAALAAIAVTQPLYDILGRNPTFFVAHHAGPADLVLFAAVVALGPAALLVSLVGALGLIGRRSRWPLLAAVALLTGAVLLPPLDRLLRVSSWGALAMAAGLGVLAALAYARLAWVRSFLTLLAAGVLVFPLLFLFDSPVARLIRAERAGPAPVTGVPGAPPIVFVVFDGLSLESLLDGSGAVDAGRYPSFARLARSATWYRGTTAVSDVTELAVPAILTGRYPQARLGIPTAVDHPENLFTLLAGAYDMNVHETITQLCPVWLCGAPAPESIVEKHGALLADAAIVYAHFLVPQSLRGRLPSIEGRWRDFAAPTAPADERALESRAAGATVGDRGGAFDRFVASVGPRSRPTLHFHHTVLPHSPFGYFPTGREYHAPADIWGLRFVALNAGSWSPEPAPVELAQLRYLLQLAFADRLLGRLLDRLEATDLLDSALVVVTADHGAAFTPGQPHRQLRAENLLEIAPVPLFVKAPGQREAAISDRPTETVDVLPTVAALAGIALPWRVDGVAVQDPTPREVREFVHHSGRPESFVYGAAALRDVVARRIARFGAGNAWPAIFAHGAAEEILGRPAEGLTWGGMAPYAAELRSGAAIEVRDAVPLPAYVQGELVPTGAPPSEPPIVAIGVDGTIATTAGAVRRPDGVVEFQALLAEQSLRAGTHRLEVFLVDTRDGAHLLRPQRMRSP